VLGGAAKDRSVLYELCDSDEPLVAGAANAVVSYFWENQGDLERALQAARRTLEAFADQKLPYLQAAARSRIAELCLQVERGDEARRQLMAVMPVLERLGAWSDLVGLRWWMVLANLQLGAVDEAEHWLEETAPPRADEPVGVLTYGLGVRAEILLARGEVEAGLRLWRRAVDLLRNAEEPLFGMDVDPSQEPWTLEATAVAVVAHAQHDRLDLVEEVTGELPDRLSAMLMHPVANPPPYLMELPIAGGLLLALAMVDLDRGARTGDQRATRSGVRMIALAERLRFLPNFHPTMSAAGARQAPTHADRPAYDEAVSSYAGLGQEDLRAAALAALRQRERG
jgi:tetratricopeptide (TPR) repeat protein